MGTNLPTRHTMAERALERPPRSRYFGRSGIDFNCGGKKALNAARDRRALPSSRAYGRLAALSIEAAQNQELDVSTETLANRIDRILDAHDQYLPQDLLRWGAMLRKVKYFLSGFPGPPHIGCPALASLASPQCFGRLKLRGLLS
jgi:iron-sulfur cluster repair protein YtfE (RIC family)